MDHQYHLRQGAEVFGSDGGKVGKVKTYGGQHLVVEKGFFFPTDYFIPFSAVDNYTEDEVYLKVSKDEALNQGWDTEPVEDPATVPDSDTQSHGYNTGALEKNAFELDPEQRNVPAKGSRPDTVVETGRSTEPAAKSELIRDR